MVSCEFKSNREKGENTMYKKFEMELAGKSYLL